MLFKKPVFSAFEICMSYKSQWRKQHTTPGMPWSEGGDPSVLDANDPPN